MHLGLKQQGLSFTMTSMQFSSRGIVPIYPCHLQYKGIKTNMHVENVTVGINVKHCCWCIKQNQSGLLGMQSEHMLQHRPCQDLCS